MSDPRIAPGRRTFIAGLGALFLRPGAVNAADRVEIETFDAKGGSLGVSSLDKIVRTDDDWRARLSPIAYRVTRREGTEAAFTGALWDNHADGLYLCVGCDTALFDSRTKFESGTGWPSFTQPVAENVIAYHVDRSHGMVRVETTCNVCDAHLGHVFPDGPRPTGLRYCMNAVALRKLHD